MIDRELIERSFEHAAETLGDITPLTYQRFFAHFPDAEPLFDIKGPQFRNDLKAQMVRDAIYAFLEYLDTPEEVDIVFKYTIPQHQDLDIPMVYFTGLLDAVAAVVCDAAPASEKAATEASWRALLAALRGMVERHAT
ncbi:MAG TPA: globin [Porticoccaceae bacterium]|nr:globin [Porticoccaceae bacterium]